MSVTEYEAKFTELSRYATQLIPDETTRCRRFQRGLNFKIRKELTGQGEQQEQVNQPDPNARMIEAVMRLAEQNAQLLELQARRPHTSLAKQFIDLGAKEFTGTIDPAEAENWLKDAVRILNRMGVANDDKVDLVAFMFKGEALHWWEATERLLTMPVPGVVPAVPQRITWARDHGIPADSFYQVRPECTDVPKTKFKIKAGKTLSVRKWQAAFSPEGYLDIGRTLSRIHRGGVHPSIRGEVWEFLLGCYDPKSTTAEREEIRHSRRAQYAVLKEECRQLFPIVGSGRFITAPVITDDGVPIQDPIVLLEANPQKGPVSLPQENGTSHSSALAKEEDKKVIQWKLTLHQIGLDVVRTDRTLVFYEKQENLSKLWDILAVYAWFDSDVGYCQGMSDLCSPMIILLEDEADAFWCFEHLMRKLRGNFRCTETSVGVETQLCNLASITQVIDPKLHQHLETLGGGDYLFAFRMLMVLFRREFSFGDSLYLWEMMWALEYDPDLFSLYEDPESVNEKAEGSKGKPKSIRQYGKYERENKTLGAKGAEAQLPISVFLVASVLKDRSTKLLTEARGLDDVVKILNDITGNLDARKACTGAMKLHKKYLKKAKKT
ncbi:hypothetical protein Vadar_033333 [Vaccinium darrowii]|uniref:Uncharacterized protein n=1 Tax=Vaccinium darrowii TaxID=229202 RepID=A0ACB7XVA6_9ERIC|nr:hypothetical protein Vadar_033333 [Vaccinium darrowii]